MQRFFYDVYGLTIESEIRCPELSGGAAPADVRVSYGDVPHSLGVNSPPGRPYEATPDQFLLRLDGIADYLVSAGTEIIIDPAPDAEDERVRLYLLGAAFGALFHQRGTLVLHGSAIETDRGAVVFSAPSRTGKSTLARAFVARGYRALADDICAISFTEEGRPVVSPGYPQMKLWADAAGFLEQETTSLVKVAGDRDKYIVPIADSFCAQPLPLRAIYVLNLEPSDFVVQRLEGVNRFDALVRDTYRAEFLEAMGAQRTHFRNVLAASRVVPVSRLGYPRDLALLSDAVGRIEADLNDRVAVRG